MTENRHGRLWRLAGAVEVEGGHQWHRGRLTVFTKSWRQLAARRYGVEFTPRLPSRHRALCVNAGRRLWTVTW